MGLADRIRVVMGTMGPSEFARVCGVTPASVTFWLGGDTKTLKAEPVARMEATFGYRASWIVLGKGPMKLGESEVEIPLSADLKKKVLLLDEGDRSKLENVLSAILDFRAVSPSSGANRLQLIHGEPPSGAYPETQKESGAADDAKVPERKRHGRTKNLRPPHEKGGGGA